MMKGFLIILGIAMTINFAGGFLIRLIWDSDFYIAEFIGGIIGIIVLVVGIFAKGKMKPDDSSF
ncbi:hypothetical protein [Lentibacillus sp. CBA3610]|uniref:hypothetical protein n=1 Tax=Lentibacillus sp. CBA3610 TaxID=2518176 RepID=UPI001596025B|nr:hypothetical protein [Lentibacillus sp. CBA3610]